MAATASRQLQAALFPSRGLAAIANQLLPFLSSYSRPFNPAAASAGQRCGATQAYPGSAGGRGRGAPPPSFDDEPAKRKKQAYVKNPRPGPGVAKPAAEQPGQKQRLAKACTHGLLLGVHGRSLVMQLASSLFASHSIICLFF